MQAGARKLIAETGEDGQERQLWAREINGVTEYDMVVNGVFLMSSDSAETEKLLVRRGIEIAGCRKGDILIGGLGMGFSVREACENQSSPVSIDVVEIDPVVFTWNLQLIDRNRAYLADPRVALIQDDFVHFVRKTKKKYHVICMDIDNGPMLLVYEKNEYAYSSSFFARVRKALYENGVFAIWSGNEDARLYAELSASFRECHVEEVYQDIQGKPISYYLYFGLK
ncbi:MAG: hypothetical protein FWH28_04425 [Clostridiales bacterium]|nr:hypothetical protein [Clostridiales bacterium]